MRKNLSDLDEPYTETFCRTKWHQLSYLSAYFQGKFNFHGSFWDVFPISQIPLHHQNHQIQQNQKISVHCTYYRKIPISKNTIVCHICLRLPYCCCFMLQWSSQLDVSSWLQVLKPTLAWLQPLPHDPSLSPCLPAQDWRTIAFEGWIQTHAGPSAILQSVTIH